MDTAKCGSSRVERWRSRAHELRPRWNRSAVCVTLSALAPLLHRGRPCLSRCSAQEVPCPRRVLPETPRLISAPSTRRSSSTSSWMMRRTGSRTTACGSRRSRLRMGWTQRSLQTRRRGRGSRSSRPGESWTASGSRRAVGSARSSSACSTGCTPASTQEVTELTDRRVVFVMRDCRVQAARKRRGLADFPCKSVGLVEYAFFAKTVDPRIRTRCLACPPDEHGPDAWCAWEFTVDRDGSAA